MMFVGLFVGDQKQQKRIMRVLRGGLKIGDMKHLATMETIYWSKVYVILAKKMFTEEEKHENVIFCLPWNVFSCVRSCCGAAVLGCLQRKLK